MILEHKHKNFKDQYTIKERVKKINNRRHMSICTCGFRMTLLSGTYKLVNSPFKYTVDGIFKKSVRTSRRISEQA